MTLQTADRQRIITLLDELPSEALAEVADFMEFLRLKDIQKKAATPRSEVALLEVINRRLSPEEQNRLSQLQEKVGTAELTPAEHQELLVLVAQIEHANVERAEALLELARLRNVTPTVIFNEFAPATADAG